MENQPILSLKLQSDLESRKGKSFMVSGEVLRFNGFSVINGIVVISTDVKMIVQPVEGFENFLGNLVQVTGIAPVQCHETRKAAREGVNSLSEMREILLASFREVSSEPTDVKIKKAETLSSLAKSFVDVIKTEISIAKMLTTNQ